MTRINYKSDFVFRLNLKWTGVDDGSLPDYDWTLRLWTLDVTNPYIVARRNGAYINCVERDGVIVAAIDNPGFRIGMLKGNLSEDIPDEMFPDGFRHEERPVNMDVELICGRSDDPTDAEVEILLPYIKGDKGDAFTYEDFTPEQIADLQKPATEAAKNAEEVVTQLKQDTETAISDSEKATATALKASEDADAVNTRITEAEQSRAEAEQSRVAAEQSRVTEFNTLKTSSEAATQSANDAATSANQAAATANEAAQGIDAKIAGKADSFVTTPDLFLENGTLGLTSRQKERLLADAIYLTTGNRNCYDETQELPYLVNEVRLSYSEALYSYVHSIGVGNNLTIAFRDLSSLKTNIIRNCAALESPTVSLNRAFMNCYSLETAIVPSVSVGNLNRTFHNCKKLRKIIGFLDLARGGIDSSVFAGCEKLESFAFSRMEGNAVLTDCPKLNIATFLYLINNRYGNGTITITVHPDVYAKLTGDETSEAYNALTDEEKEQWTSLLETAADKNITFTTV